MAYYRRRRRWRRRRNPRRRRVWRRRRAFRRRARRRVFRPRFRGFRRRLWVRRRRRFRKRQYKGPVTQWNPQHRVGCRIRGWVPLLLCIKGHFGEKSEVFWQSKDKPDAYYQCGGAVSFRHFTLGMFFREHQLFRNRWSRSNQGYDLARYFGTKITAWPHPWLDYFLYWETSFTLPERDEMANLHPAHLLTTSKKILVRSLNHKGRKKRIFIKPPPVHTNQWYFQATWCNIPLFKVGVVPFNMSNPFLHTGNMYGVWIGYTSDTDTSHTITWTRDDIEGSWQRPRIPSPPNGGNMTNLGNGSNTQYYSTQNQWARRCYYRWWWDDGKDNYVMMNKYNLDPKESGVNSCEVVKVEMPYWMYFYGLPYLTSKQQGAKLCVAGKNPSIYALTWYKDTECDGQQWNGEWDTVPVYPPPGKLFGYPDQDLCGPTRIPQYGDKKYWVWIGPEWPWLKESYHTTESWCLPDYDSAREVFTRLVGSGPYVMNYNDITFASRTLNLAISYKSFWQWGGYRPRPDTTEDPCKVGDKDTPGPRKNLRRVSIDDPSNVHKVTVHPWDLEQTGLYTNLCLKRLIQDVYPELSTENRALEQPDQPREPQSKFRRIEDEPSPASSSDDSGSSWGDAASSSEGEAKEGPALPRPHPRLHRKRHRREWRLLGKQRHRKLVRFLESTSGVRGYRT
nr:MAG: ORF1 [Torque teno polar bear virus 12]